METNVIARFLLATICLVSIVNSKPTTQIIRAELQPLTLIAPASSQFHTQDNLGQYSYGYTDEHSSKIEVKTLDGITRGGYNYIDAEGKLQSVQYISDANGFRVHATNLPQPIHENIVNDAVEIKSEADIKAHVKTSAEEIMHEERNEAKSGEEPIEKVAQTPIPPAAIPIPSGVSVQPSLLAPLPLHTIAPIATLKLTPGITYSYEYSLPASTLTYTTFASQLNDEIYLKRNHIFPVDTPEVAKAKAEHFAAIEEAKARNA